MRCLVICIASIIILQGCVAIQSYPTIARGGDTISLAVGSPDGMNKSNTTAEFVSDVDGSVVSLPIRSILKIRPDATSALAYEDGITNAEAYYTGHSQWLSVVVIDLPQGMTIGTGVVNITTTSDPGVPTGINDVPVTLEIVEGIGSASAFEYNNGFGGISPGDISKLEPLEQMVVKPPKPQFHGNAINVAAAEIKVNVPIRTTEDATVPDRSIRVVNDDYYLQNARDQLQVSWSRSGDVFTVNFISPTSTMEYGQSRFSIVKNPSHVFSLNPGPSILSVKYYDIDGNLLTFADNNVPRVSDFEIVIE